MTNGMTRFKAECRPRWNIPFTGMGMHKDGFEDLIMLKLKYHLVLIKDSYWVFCQTVGWVHVLAITFDLTVNFDIDRKSEIDLSSFYTGKKYRVKEKQNITKILLVSSLRRCEWTFFVFMGNFQIFVYSSFLLKLKPWHFGVSTLFILVLIW